MMLCWICSDVPLPRSVTRWLHVYHRQWCEQDSKAQTTCLSGLCFVRTWGRGVLFEFHLHSILTGYLQLWQGAESSTSMRVTGYAMLQMSSD